MTGWLDSGIFGSEILQINPKTFADSRGIIRGDDLGQVYREPCEVVEVVINHWETTGRPLPERRTRPMVEARASAG